MNACKENKLCKTFGLRECDIDKIAEQLKEGCKNPYNPDVLKIEMSQEDLLKFKEMIKNMPIGIISTLEVESSVQFIDEQIIRNKAIDDFAEQLKAEYKPCEKTDEEIYKKVCIRIEKIAEQLKAKGRRRRK